MKDKNTREKINDFKTSIRAHPLKRTLSKNVYKKILGDFSRTSWITDQKITFSGRDAYLHYTSGDEKEISEPMKLFPNFANRVGEKILDLEIKYEDQNIKYHDGSIIGFCVDKIINPIRRGFQYLEDLESDRTATGSSYSAKKFDNAMRAAGKIQYEGSDAWHEPWDAEDVSVPIINGQELR